MSEYDMPICKQHKKELLNALNRLMVAWGITLILAFVAGFAFCKVVS